MIIILIKFKYDTCIKHSMGTSEAATILNLIKLNAFKNNENSYIRYPKIHVLFTCNANSLTNLKSNF